MRFKPLQVQGAPCAALLTRRGPLQRAGRELREAATELPGGGLQGWWERGWSQWGEILQGRTRHPLLFCLSSCNGCPSLPVGSGATAARLRASLSCPAGNYCCPLRPGGWGEQTEKQVKWNSGWRNLVGTPGGIVCCGFSRSRAVDLAIRPITVIN